MAPRTRAQLLADFADNTTGNITEARLRALVDSIALAEETGDIAASPTAPVYRGSSQVFSGAGSFNIALPAGSVAGDTAFLFCFGGNLWNSPTAAGGEWTTLGSYAAFSGWSGAIFTKVLTAADITAGTVTVNTSGFASTVSMIVYQGAPVNTAYFDVDHFSAGTTIAQNKPWRTKRPLRKDDDLVIVMTTRASAACTSSIGTLLQTQQNGNGSMALYRYAVPATGFIDSTINIPASGYEQYICRLAMRGY